jgi:hypothetical protein
MQAFSYRRERRCRTRSYRTVAATRLLIPKQIAENDLRPLPAKAPNRVPQPTSVLLRSHALGAIRRIALPPDLGRPDRPSPARQDRVVTLGRAQRLSDQVEVRVGRFIRRLNIDELPQLINVSPGEMSLVGPRPLVLEEDRRIEGWHRRRLDIRPGITGPWQVLGSARIPVREMVKLDYHVADWSLWSDIRHPAAHDRLRRAPARPGAATSRPELRSQAARAPRE